MCARGSSTSAAKLERLLAMRGAESSCSSTTAPFPNWVNASVYPLQALHILKKPTLHQNHHIWVPSCFLETAAAQETPSQELKPPLPFLDRKLISRASMDSEWDYSVQPLLNASFLHETSLFTLLLCHPLPSSRLTRFATTAEQRPASTNHSSDSCDEDRSPDVNGFMSTRSALSGHYWMQHGAWRVAARYSEGETWLDAAAPALQTHFACSSEKRADQDEAVEILNVDVSHFQDERGDVRRARLASGDYLENLIWPTDCSGDARPGLAADSVWVDAATVRRYALTYYEDAIWVPFHPRISFAAWNRLRLLHSPVVYHSMSKVESVRFNERHANTAAGDESQFKDTTTDPEWLGKLYIRPLA